MKILELNLLAFGPFTDETIDFSAGDPGLHLVYGPNEAGKSSALHALVNLLYGIPTQNDDDFLHSYQNMRIGAVLEGADGKRLSCIRRKGKAKTLRAADDETILEEAELKSMLADVDQASFTRRFGISYEALQAGGAEIVAGGGDLGKSLFAAASGVADLTKLQDSLHCDCDDLYLPKGKIPRVNAGLAKHKELLQEMKQATLPSEEFDRHLESLNHARTEKEALEQQLGTLAKERSRCQRLLKAIPLAHRRQHLLDELAPLADVPLLSEDFATHRREVDSKRAIATAALKQAEQEIANLTEQLDNLEVSEVLLANATRIDQLQEQNGSIKKAQADRVDLLRNQELQLAQAKEQLAALGRADVSLDAAESMRLPADVRVHIQDLGNQKSALVKQAEYAQQQVDRTRQNQQSIQERIDASPSAQPTTTLRDLIKAARAEGDLDTSLRECRLLVKRLDDQTSTQLASLGHWSGSVAAARSLPAPNNATIDRFEEEFDALGQQHERTLQQQEETQRELDHCNEQLDRLRHQHDVPTEDDLLAAREKRDSAWKLLIREFAGKPASGEEWAAIFGAEIQEDRQDATYAAILAADEIADRLRREADGVATKAQLLAQQETLTGRLNKISASLESIQQDRNELEERWQQQWQATGITDLRPREARSWLRKLEKLQASSAELAEARRQEESQQQTAAAHREGLLAELARCNWDGETGDETLGPLLAAAERLAEQLEETSRKQEQLAHELSQAERSLPELQAELTSASDQLANWATQWKTATKPLQLRTDASPAEANAVLATIDAMLECQSKSAEYERRITSIDRDFGEFSTDVSQMIDQLNIPQPDASIQQSVATLVDQLRRSRRAASRREELVKQVERQQHLQQTSQQDLTGLDAKLQALCREAQCESFDSLPKAEEQSQQRRNIEQELRSLLQSLGELTDGGSLDDFADEARRSEEYELTSQIEELSKQVAALEGQKSELDQTIGREQGEIARMDGRAVAAAALQQSQQVEAQVLADARHYARLYLSTIVLDKAIARYREKNEAPVLSRAKELFQELTLGSFEGLRPDYDREGKTVLVGVRQGKEVPVSAMSEGTADQLYLALRLASLEHNLQSEHPIRLPLIVDDILVKFDDDRSAAALRVLARLADHTQVIMFTHHEHIVKLAEETLDEDMLFVQELGASRAMANS